MTRVLANGTFDFLHPGHIHYLRESAALGDELYVVIARDSRANQQKDDLRLDEKERRKVVNALDMVDKAILGSKDSIFDTVDRLEPDIVTLGYDQDFDEDELEKALSDQGHDIDVVRIESSTSHSSTALKSE
ncbi:MAG: adenylyltransferase/cytidyltransferase family protein [Candidatus Nanohaloarchaea archaeon]|nr:adenylyltransferase/cytidyltransferase family protein [Candidatus Nanohaloarchaea archaeon]